MFTVKEIYCAEFTGCQSVIDLCQRLMLLTKDELGQVCKKCGAAMRMVANEAKSGGFWWACNKKVALRQQAAKKSNTACSIRTALMHQTGFESHTAVDLACFCREVLLDAFFGGSQLGGVGVEVQIDESEFGHRKYNRGHRVDRTLHSRSADTGGNAPKAFVRDASTSRLLDCRRVMQNDVNYMKGIAKNRITYQDLPDLPMDCASIKARNYFPSKPNSEQEASFPLAQARIVYKDYRFLEMELAAGYAPQNWYCFAIDEKADKLFHERMHALASCLPNILTTLHEYNVDGTGKNMITSYMECLKLLTAASKHQNKHWKYVSLLQHHARCIPCNFDINITSTGKAAIDLHLGFSQRFVVKV